MKLTYLLILTSFLLLSCKNDPSAKTDKIVNHRVEETKNEIPKVKKKINNNSKKINLLQGLWQNIESDKKIEFKNSRFIDIKDGIQNNEGAVFSLTDKCEQKNIVTPAKATDKIISIISLNQCYFIVQLDGKTLKLGDLSTGKTTTYNKVSE